MCMSCVCYLYIFLRQFFEVDYRLWIFGKYICLDFRLGHLSDDSSVNILPHSIYIFIMCPHGIYVLLNIFIMYISTSVCCLYMYVVSVICICPSDCFL